MPNPNRQARYPRDLVKLLNENIDLDALVFDTDASGNPIVVDSKSGDTIAFYDRDTGEWNLSDINIQSLDADSINTGSVDITNAGNVLSIGEPAFVTTIGVIEDIGATSSTTYERVAQGDGALDFRRLPDGVTIYGNLWARLEAPSGTDAVYLRPEFRAKDAGNTEVSELEISHDGDGTSTDVESGWTEITSLSADRFHTFRALQAKVDGGSGRVNGNLWGFQLEARVE